MKKIPEKGFAKEKIIELMEQYRANDMNWRDGRAWAYIYDPGEEASEVIKHAYMSFLSENALDPTAFPSMLRFETELVSMAASHLGGDQDVVGNFTSGGTESIILAVKAARDYNRDKRPNIREPEMILPETAHAAFHKAAHYLDVKTVMVPIDPATYKADVDAIQGAITPNTIMLVGSAVSYAHGVIDPIEHLGKLAQEHELWLHVDACMGGFLLPYFKRLGSPVPPFDFSVPGVSSISMDFHKYAFAAKGASVVLYRNKQLRKYQIYTCASWSGYSVINNTIQSTKTGGPLAAAWAIVNFLGDEGYLELARNALQTTKIMADAIDKMDDLRLMAYPEMNLLSFTSDTVDVFHIIDEMKQLGWFIQPQLSFHSSKENIHLSINPSNRKWVDDFLADLQKAVQRAKSAERSELPQLISSMFAGEENIEFNESVFEQMLSMAGIKGVELPERLAEINQVLNALPAKVREKMLTEFFNELYRYRE